MIGFDMVMMMITAIGFRFIFTLVYVLIMNSYQPFSDEHLWRDCALFAFAVVIVNMCAGVILAVGLPG